MQHISHRKCKGIRAKKHLLSIIISVSNGGCKTKYLPEMDWLKSWFKSAKPALYKPVQVLSCLQLWRTSIKIIETIRCSWSWYCKLTNDGRGGGGWSKPVRQWKRTCLFYGPTIPDFVFCLPFILICIFYLYFFFHFAYTIIKKKCCNCFVQKCFLLEKKVHKQEYEIL